MSILITPYPHLLPEDTPVWKRFLDKYGHQFNSFDYDVRVGFGRPAPDNFPDNIKKMAIELSQRRIDAVGHTAAGILVIEITRHAGLKAIGQLEVYPFLYRQRFDPRQKVKPLLVCEELGTDIEPILIDKNIDYVILPGEYKP